MFEENGYCENVDPRRVCNFFHLDPFQKLFSQIDLSGDFFIHPGTSSA
jgi:hypothetical protein